MFHPQQQCRLHHFDDQINQISSECQVQNHKEILTLQSIVVTLSNIFIVILVLGFVSSRWLLDFANLWRNGDDLNGLGII